MLERLNIWRGWVLAVDDHLWNLLPWLPSLSIPIVYQMNTKNIWNHCLYLHWHSSTFFYIFLCVIFFVESTYVPVCVAIARTRLGNASGGKVFLGDTIPPRAPSYQAHLQHWNMYCRGDLYSHSKGTYANLMIARKYCIIFSERKYTLRSCASVHIDKQHNIYICMHTQHTTPHMYISYNYVTMGLGFPRN